MRGRSYRKAVKWMARNDPYSMSIILVADVFGKEVDEVADDVLFERGERMSTPMNTAGGDVCSKCKRRIKQVETYGSTVWKHLDSKWDIKHTPDPSHKMRSAYAGRKSQ